MRKCRHSQIKSLQTFNTGIGYKQPIGRFFLQSTLNHFLSVGGIAGNKICFYLQNWSYCNAVDIEITAVVL